MTRIEVSSDAIMALGAALMQVADDLEWHAVRSSEQAWALGPGDSAGALAAVLGDFEHQRQVLGRALDDLATRAVRAGRLYAEVESQVDTGVDASLDGGAG
jgi:hypothetical protein